MANRAERRRQEKAQPAAGKGFYYIEGAAVDYGTNNPGPDVEAGTVPLVQARLAGRWSNGTEANLTLLIVAPIARELGTLIAGAADDVVVELGESPPTRVETLPLDELEAHATRRGITVDDEGGDPIQYRLDLVAACVRKGAGVRYDLELTEDQEAPDA